MDGFVKKESHILRLDICRLRDALPGKLLVSFCVLVLSSFALAQTGAPNAGSGGENAGLDPRKSYDFGFHMGPFLPYKISGVTEVLAGWGLRVSIPTSKGVFELSNYIARSDGTQYNVGSLDFRLDIANEYLPVHALLGMHGDFYVPPNKGMKYGGGWQYGGGVSQRLGGQFYFRADFLDRFGPSESVYIGVGLFYRMAEGGG